MRWALLANARFRCLFFSSFLVALATDHALQQAMAAQTSGRLKDAKRSYRAALKAPLRHSEEPYSQLKAAIARLPRPLLRAFQKHLLGETLAVARESRDGPRLLYRPKNICGTPFTPCIVSNDIKRRALRVLPAENLE